MYGIVHGSTEWTDFRFLGLRFVGLRFLGDRFPSVTMVYTVGLNFSSSSYSIMPDTDPTSDKGMILL